MSRKLTTDTDLTSIANAIRTKGGTSASLVFPTGFVSAIENIQGGLNTSDATATANDMLSGKTAYVDGQKITGNIPSKSSSNLTVSEATVTAPAGYYSNAATKTIDSGSTTQNAPTIDSSTGLVTATATVIAGYQAADTKSNTLQLTTQAAQTITPTTTDQTITSGKYLIGTQTIKGDADLIPANIKNGVSIFNVTGTGMTDVLLEQNSDGVINIPNTTSDVNTLRLQGKNATPSAIQQNITPDNNYDGLSQVTISGDSNLIADNIAEGVSIFGVTGTHSGGSATEYVTFSFSGGNSWYVWGMTNNGQVNGVVYNSGTNVQLVKNSLFIIGMAYNALNASSGLSDISNITFANFNNAQFNNTTNNVSVTYYSGSFMRPTIGFATGNASFVANVD